MFCGCKTYKRAKNVLANFIPKPYDENRKRNERLMSSSWTDRTDSDKKYRKFRRKMARERES